MSSTAPATPGPDIERPPLTDLITTNLDHYRLSADYKHGLHYTALPTAWVSGFSRSTELRIGSSTAWVAELPGAKAGFLEFTGQGLSTFHHALDRAERHMAVLGSRMLEDIKKVGETATAIELRQAGEHSVLSSIATSVSESLTQVLRWVYWWSSVEATPDAIPARRGPAQPQHRFQHQRHDQPGAAGRRSRLAEPAPSARTPCTTSCAKAKSSPKAAPTKKSSSLIQAQVGTRSTASPSRHPQTRSNLTTIAPAAVPI